MEQAEHEIEATDSLGLSDVILPSQFFGAMGGGGLCSEQRLMLAVLVDAINILQGWNRMGRARKRRTFAEAAQWVIMKGTNYPFSFDSVCDALNIESGNAASAPRRACEGARSGRPLAHRQLALERVEPRSADDGNPCEPPSFELSCRLDS